MILNKQTPIDGESLKNSITQLRVYCESLSYTISTETPQTDQISLLAKLGGHLCLCLGVSLFSLGKNCWSFQEIFKARI